MVKLAQQHEDTRRLGLSGVVILSNANKMPRNDNSGNGSEQLTLLYFTRVN